MGDPRHDDGGGNPVRDYPEHCFEIIAGVRKCHNQAVHEISGKGNVGEPALAGYGQIAAANPHKPRTLFDFEFLLCHMLSIA